MESAQAGEAFTEEQKEYLQGFFAGVTARIVSPFVGQLPDGKFTAQAGPGIANLAAQPAPEKTVFGTPVSDLCEQEIWKLEQHGLDIWDKLLAHAEENKFPDKADTFRFRYHGLFYVAPAQNSFMLRCRIAAGQLTAEQFRGLSEIAEDWGNGYADITTRANIQIREIAPRHIVKVLLKLEELGLTSRGSGVDNVRNITASPTAGIDPSEVINTQPYAKALHYYILNNRDLYDLPRKFNVGFDGGGSISVVADTNDIGFIATRVKENEEVPAGVYFRVQLAGITGHQQFAVDAGILVRPEQCVAVGAAVMRVYVEHGDRTNRKKARLKYLIDRWGIPKFLEEVEKKLSFPLTFFPFEKCVPSHPPVLHGHLGVYKQSQKNRNYIGVAVPVGRLRVRAMRRIADLARNYGSGELRLTVWQNMILPDITPFAKFSPAHRPNSRNDNDRPRNRYRPFQSVFAGTASGWGFRSELVVLRRTARSQRLLLSRRAVANAEKQIAGTPGHRLFTRPGSQSLRSTPDVRKCRSDVGLVAGRCACICLWRCQADG
jgi:ferredoxin-nitrite reductase